MEKFTCILLVAVLMFVVVACGTSDGSLDDTQGVSDSSSSSSELTSNAKANITVYGWGNGTEIDTHKAKVDLFNEKNGMNITAAIECVPSGDYMTKLNAMLSAGNAPDVLMESADFNGFYYRTGDFENLTPYVEKDNLDLENILIPGVDSGNVHNGNYREALPFTGNSMVIAYNMDLFDTMGVSYPPNDWSWDDFSSICETLTRGEGADKQYAMSDHWGVKIYAPYAFGGALYTLDGTPTMKASDEDTIKGIEFFADLQRKGYMPDSAAAEGMPSEQRFFGGKAGMIFFFLWDKENFTESIGDNFKWSVVELPSNSDGEKSTLTWTTGYAMNSASKSKDASWEFIKSIALDEGSNKLNENIGIPVLASMMDTYKENIIGDAGVKASIFCNVFEYGVINPLGGAFNELADEYTRYWDQIILDGKSVRDQLNELQISGQPILDSLTQVE